MQNSPINTSQKLATEALNPSVSTGSVYDFQSLECNLLSESTNSLQERHPNIKQIAATAKVLESSGLLDSVKEVREVWQQYVSCSAEAKQLVSAIASLESERDYKLKYSQAGLQKTIDSLSASMSRLGVCDKERAVAKQQLSEVLPDIVRAVSRALRKDLGLDKEVAKELSKALLVATEVDPKLLQAIPAEKCDDSAYSWLIGKISDGVQASAMASAIPWCVAGGHALREEMKAPLETLQAISKHVSEATEASPYLIELLESKMNSGPNEGVTSVKQVLLQVAHQFKQHYGMEVTAAQSFETGLSRAVVSDTSRETFRNLRRQEYHAINAELVAQYRTAEEPSDKDRILKEILEVNHPLVLDTVSGLVAKYKLGSSMIEEWIPTAKQAIWEVLDKDAYRPEESGYKFSTYIVNAIKWACLDDLKWASDGQGRFKSGSLKSSSLLNMTDFGVVMALDSHSSKVKSDPIAYYEGFEPDSMSSVMPPILESQQPFSQVTIDLLREDLLYVLDTLSLRERDVMKLRYGLASQDELDNFNRVTGLSAVEGEEIGIRSIASFYNLSRGRIDQIEGKALRKLRHPNRNRVIKGYNDESL